MTQPALFAVEDGGHARVADGAFVMSSARAGDDSELAFERAALKRGWRVCSPRGIAEEFDYIVKRKGGRPVVVQVKRAAMQHNKESNYNIRCCKTRGPRASAGVSARRVPYEAEAFDVLAAHLPDLDKFVFFTLGEINGRTSVGYTPPDRRQNQRQQRAVAARNPDNWELLDDVAESLTLSGPTPANVLPPSPY